MTKLEELATAIGNLPEEEYRKFRRWFIEKHQERWDRQIAEDSGAGKLDFLIKEALDAKSGYGPVPMTTMKK
jgi:hypothetical protein